jgi:hypothetical protein
MTGVWKALTVTTNLDAYSPERGTAIHEAGHAVMAYLLGRAFISISVVADDDSTAELTITCRASGSSPTSTQTPAPCACWMTM